MRIFGTTEYNQYKDVQYTLTTSDIIIFENKGLDLSNFSVQIASQIVYLYIDKSLLFSCEKSIKYARKLQNDGKRNFQVLLRRV